MTDDRRASDRRPPGGPALGRRRLLAAGAAAAAGALAGCNGADDGNGGDDDGTTASETTTTTPSLSERAEFFDDFEDGDYLDDPGWEVEVDEGDFTPEVEDRETPRGGEHVLSLSETLGGGSQGRIVWEEAVEGWDGPWTLRGLFYTADVDTEAPFQDHVVEGADGDVRLQVGYTFPDAEAEPVRITGDLVGDPDETLEVDWREETWYRYELRHDGEGEYAARFRSVEEDPPVRSTGDPPDDDPMWGGLVVNGARQIPFRMDHAFQAWTRTDGG